MIKNIATVIGIAFILAGLAGFVAPGLLGFHLSPVHNIIHLVSGAVSIYLGLKGTLSAARMFGFVFGLVYFLLGVAGFLFGSQGAEHGQTLFRVIPGILELGPVDNIFHLVVGSLYLLGAFLSGSGTTSENG